MLLGDSCRFRCVLVLLGIGGFAALLRADERVASEKVDAFGDPLPKGAIARIGTVRLRQPSAVCSVAYSPDGKLLATGGRYDVDGVRLWDASTGKLVRFLSASVGEGIFGLYFAPEGKSLVSNSYDGACEVWDVATGKKTHELANRPKHLGPFKFSRDGKFLAAIDRDTMRVWETAGWTERLPPRDGKKVVLESFAGQRLYVSNEKGDDHIWDLAALERTMVPKNWRPGGWTALTPDGKRLAMSDWNREGPFLVQRDAITGKEHFRVAVAGENNPSVNALCYSPDGKLLAVGGVGVAVRCIDSQTGKETVRFGDQGAYVNQNLAFSPDGKNLAVGSRSSIRIWDVASGKEALSSSELSSAASALAFSPDGKRLAFGDDRWLRLFDLTTHKTLWRCAGGEDGVRQIAFTPDGKAVVFGKRLWRFVDATNGKESLSWEKPARRIESLGASYSRNVVSADFTRVVFLHIASFVETPSVLVISAATGKDLLQFDRDEGRVIDANVSPNGKLLAIVYRQSHVQLYSLRNGKKVARLDGTESDWFRVGFAPDGRTLVLASTSGALNLMETSTGKLRNTIQSETEGGVEFWFSPDGNSFIAWDYSSSSDVPRIWDTMTGRKLAHLKGHRGAVNQAAFAPDGKLLATASQDTTILLWDVAELVQKQKAVRLTPEALAAAWKDLGDADAARAFRDMAALRVAGVQAVDFLRQRLQPVRALESDQVERWLKDLDSGRFAVREAAARELEKRFDEVAATLYKALGDKPSLEMRRRLTEIIETAETRPWTGEKLRTLRAIEVLERIGSAEARGVLETLAGGVAEARLTKEAKASVERLKR